MIRRPTTIVWAILASCAILGAQAGQTPPPPPPNQDQQPTFRARVDSVSVDATVTDKDGHPVTDLKPEDFEIREAGKVQTIENFRLIEIPETEATGREPAPAILSQADMLREAANPANRLFIIFLDDYHTRLSNSLNIRQQLASFVSRLSSRDLVALMYPLSSVMGATFTRDHDGTAAGIMQFRGRKYNYHAENAYEEYFANQPPEVQEQIRNELVIGTMKSTCALMSTLREGRKTILFVSEGLNSTLPVGVATQMNLYPTRPTALTPAQQAAVSSRQASQEYFRSQDQLIRMRDIYTLCSRGNTSVYPLDPRGLATSEFGAADVVGQDADRRFLQEATDSLRILADETNGHAIIGNNNPVPELKKMIHELSSYYLMSYTSTVAPRDGKFHEIQVKVNRKDVDIKARKGYWAYSEEEVKRATAPPRQGPPAEVSEALDDLAVVVEPTSRHTVGVWIGAVRGDDERAKVTLAWEAARGTSDLPFERPEQVTLTVTASNGEVVFKGAVPRDPNAYTPAGKVTFAAPAGPLRVKMTVENVRGQRIDSEEVNESVPDFSATGPTIAPPQIFRARTAFEIGTLRKSTTAIPNVTRKFSRSERLLMRFEAYGPGGAPPVVSMRVLNQVGEQLLPLAAPANPAPNVFEADVSLAWGPPGDYLIEISATVGSEKTVRLIGIRVTG
ncbi:MAG TPA: VWA domain-containing protein [Vicinamibacterales bacterium]|nr:VWA domain-containing protein [Vicinamibacterales bacterium]